MRESRRAVTPTVGRWMAVLPFAAGLTALPLCLPNPAAAQAFGAGAHFQGYRFDDPAIAGVESVGLFVMPFAAAGELGAVSVGLSGAYARGTATGPAGAEAELSGPTDTELVLTYRPGPDWLMISASSALPTGRGSLSTEESFVGALVAAELLPFEIASWGSGGDMGGEVAVATQAGEWGVGMAAGYRFARGYEPVPDLPFTYQPGDQLQLRFAADRNVAEASTLSFLLGFQHFTDDELENVNLFRAGTRVQSLVTYAFPLGLRSSALVFAGVNHRADGAVLTEEPALDGATDSPSQRLYMTGANLRIPLGRGSAILPKAELMVFRASDGASQGWVGTLGPTLDLRLSGNASTRQVFLSPSLMLRRGHVIVQEGSVSDFSGWEVGLTLRVVSGR